jgi:hypothetical protein
MFKFIKSYSIYEMKLLHHKNTFPIISLNFAIRKKTKSRIDYEDLSDKLNIVINY